MDAVGEPRVVIGLNTASVGEIAVLGAHCDDIAIGMGGTLLTLAGAHRGLRVHALVLSGAGGVREDEERSALSAFCPGATVALTVLDIPDGMAPAHWGRIKAELNAFRQTCAPDLVFGPHRRDAHQDHRMLAELTPTEFRDHLILGYEILKWETDTPTPALFHPIGADTAREKVRLLHEHYPSQVGRDWFDEAAFMGLSRLRGVQCRSDHAEAFVIEKAIIGFAERVGA
ncbi:MULTISPECIES: PIG-L deacetylase family protein [unclassified Mycolicibacterium]|uniref:PIG-L deacetylase family protein n=1 Tax=unclassified Mycolicibacterium TaxID=2636767 RepID=UPI0012DC8ACF|nr:MULTISPECIES: PIG-L family deacetylase [unclassified Mycolicibacterium]MUL81745.1 PIG-L family deacetylase [Mycolicibacterium sp. CBMA 329]MUL87511.1 PIG-L family deacetylase [Mycolicibacterium sp. CBMA 331]MUL99624.1 PIG-L family deacetylase [Mycolicibacterium sp. CBMA 334]MUM26721.1 PIG-L family deacetylase [Mycolicibacterium sp. CBMA 295]MUM37808.1 PIG-L family deacetylase [Mycolicibacterium sp. CBMA 247]